MDAARISDLLAPYLLAPLSTDQLHQISTYIDLLLRWNARTNLTAIRHPDEIVTRHFGESLFAAQTLYPRPADASSPADEAADLLDLGSGAGFPGVPIHLWAPHLPTVLIEAQQKKVAFLREVIRALTLTSINVLHTRAEDIRAENFPAEKLPDRNARAGHASAVNLRANTVPSAARTVTLRAVERFDHILPTAARLVAPGGRLALLIGQTQAGTAQSVLSTFQWQPSQPLPNSAERILLVGRSGPRPGG